MTFRQSKKTVGVFRFNEKIILVQELADGTLDYVLAESKNGERFRYLPTLLTLYDKKKKRALVGVTGLRGSVLGKETILSWVERGERLVIATISKDDKWKLEEVTKEFKRPTVFFETKIKGTRPTIFTLTESGRDSLALAQLEKKGKWRELGPIIRAKKGVEFGKLTVLMTEWTDRGLLVLYSAKNGWGFPLVGAFIADPEDPERILWRSADSVWEAPLSATTPPPEILSCVSFGGNILLYLEKADGAIEVLAIPKIWEKPIRPKKRVRGVPGGIPHQIIVELVRFSGNPIIEPVRTHHWESFATFNPAAIEANGRIHLLYRAQGAEGLSVLGYATSDDGFDFSDRPKIPAYIPREPFEAGFGPVSPDEVSRGYVSGGGYGGCEDPKMTLIDNRVYLTYVAFDGWHPPRIALSWIPFSDFLDRRWKEWSRPVLISPPGVVDKSAAILPEKVNGKYVIFHRVFPNILIDFVDDLESFDGRTYLRGEYAIPPRSGFWDGGKLSVGAPPIKTDRGWLVIYHATTALAEHARKDSRYKMGAMLLDLEDPTKVLVRSADAILEPETEYENAGHKFGVVYPCGAIIKNETLFVYYGASDKTVAVATAPLKDFLDRLVAHKTLHLKPLSK